MSDVDTLTEVTVANRIEERNVSSLFGALATDFTLNNPSKTGLHKEPGYKPAITETQLKSIDLILDTTTPQELAAAILDEPPLLYAEDINHPGSAPIALKPKISVEVPTEEDLMIANGPTRVDESNKNAAELLSGGIEIAKRYLKAPKIKDDFENHNVRTLWERGMLDVLNAITERQKQRQSADVSDWAREFKQIWDNNKYVRNFRSKLQMHFDPRLYGDGFEPSPQNQSRISVFYTKISEASSLPNENIDIIADKTSEACRDLLKNFP